MIEVVKRKVTRMQKAIIDICYSAMLKGTGLLMATLLLLPPASARDSATANAANVDDSAKMNGTQVKSYEEKTNTRRSLRTAANQMQQAALKDRTQTAPRKAAGTTSAKSPPTVRSTIKFKQKSRTTLH
jgi:hypothetical protein